MESENTGKTNKKQDGPSNPKQNKKTQKPKKNVPNNTPQNLDANNEAKLTEKQLRKLEWEKKLAEQKSKGGDDKQPEKENMSKAELRSKRREQQEAQRSAKVSGKTEQKPQTESKKTHSEKPKKEALKIEAKSSPIKKEITKKAVLNRVQLVQHLYSDAKLKIDNVVIHKNVHPVFVRLGVQYSNLVILGSNARCLALLAALKYLVDDLQTPPKQEFCRYLEQVLQSCVVYLQKCRPFAVAMTNALRHFKLQLTRIDTNLSDNEKRARLHQVIDNYINDDIKKAGDAISLRVQEKITDGDVILTYGCSSLVRKILLEAHRDGKRFAVAVVDGRPLLEGREMARRLAAAGVACSYAPISAVSHATARATKVLLGAHALLTNGYVMSRVGTAQVALVARARNTPVLVCCETYKFSERVQTDSFVYNEIGEPESLTRLDTINEASPIKNHGENSKLVPLNLLYDVTPPDLVTAVVTELAILPCTSVPVVLRINANEAL